MTEQELLEIHQRDLAKESSAREEAAADDVIKCPKGGEHNQQVEAELSEAGFKRGPFTCGKCGLILEA